MQHSAQGQSESQPLVDAAPNPRRDAAHEVRQESFINRRELTDEHDRRAVQSALGRPQQYVANGFGATNVARNQRDHDGTERTLREQIVLHHEHGASQCRPRSSWLAEISPPDLSATHLPLHVEQQASSGLAPKCFVFIIGVAERAIIRRLDRPGVLVLHEARDGPSIELAP